MEQLRCCFSLRASCCILENNTPLTILFLPHQRAGILSLLRCSSVEELSVFACLAWEQALRGGKRKESLPLRLWNLNVCVEKVDAKCWLAEMTIVMVSLPLAHVFQCLFTFALISASCWLAEIWQLSQLVATGQILEVVSISRDILSSSPSFFCPAARVPWRPYSQAMPTGRGLFSLVFVSFPTTHAYQGKRGLLQQGISILLLK